MPGKHVRSQALQPLNQSVHRLAIKRQMPLFAGGSPWLIFPSASHSLENLCNLHTNSLSQMSTEHLY